MTLRRALWVFTRPWMDGSVTIQEWLLACVVIQAVMDREEAR